MEKKLTYNDYELLAKTLRRIRTKDQHLLNVFVCPRASRLSKAIKQLDEVLLTITSEVEAHAFKDLKNDKKFRNLELWFWGNEEGA